MGIMRKIVLEELLNGQLLYVYWLYKTINILQIQFHHCLHSLHDTRTRIVHNTSSADLKSCYDPNVYLAATACRHLHSKLQTLSNSPSTSFLLSDTEFPPLPITMTTSNVSHYMSTALPIEPHSTFPQHPSTKAVPIPQQPPPTTVPQSPPTKAVPTVPQSPPTKAVPSSQQSPPTTVPQQSPPTTVPQQSPPTTVPQFASPKGIPSHLQSPPTTVPQPPPTKVVSSSQQSPPTNSIQTSKCSSTSMSTPIHACSPVPAKTQKISYTCEECGKEHTYRSGLAKHKKKEHPETVKAGSITCNLCFLR